MVVVGVIRRDDNRRPTSGDRDPMNGDLLKKNATKLVGPG